MSPAWMGVRSLPSPPRPMRRLSRPFTTERPMTTCGSMTAARSIFNWTSLVDVIHSAGSDPGAIGTEKAIKEGLALAQAKGLKVVFQASLESEPAATAIAEAQAAINGTSSYALYAFAAGNHNSDVTTPINITAGGSGYAVNDILSVVGGTLTTPGISQPAR